MKYNHRYGFAFVIFFGFLLNCRILFYKTPYSFFFSVDRQKKCSAAVCVFLFFTFCLNSSFIHSLFCIIFICVRVEGIGREAVYFSLYFNKWNEHEKKNSSKLLHVCGKMFCAKEMFEAVQMYTIQFMKGIVEQKKKLKWK